MIIKGKSRSGAAALAAHLGNAEKNERVSLLETRGTIARDLRGALIEMEAHALGTRCEKPLYHAAISPEPPHRLTDEQRSEAIDALEEKLGLTGHARVVVMHEKLGRQHIHVVWSRIDLDRMRSVSDSHNYRKHEEVARDLERRFGHDRVQGAHHEREGVERPDRTPSRAELRQEERTGITGKEVKQEVTAAFRASDSPEAFKAALEERGYVLAQGDRRDFVVLDRKGGIHSLARRVDDLNAAELRKFMAPLAREILPDVRQAFAMTDEGKRLAQVKEDQLEKGYARGWDYVTQTTAAQKDIQEHRRKLKRRFNPGGEGPKGSGKKSREDDRKRLRLEDEQKSQASQSELTQPTKTAEVGPYDGVEMTERMTRLLGHINEQHTSKTDHEPDAGPDRQGTAPGGGRTRSR